MEAEMVIALVSLSLAWHVGIVVWVRRALQRNEDRCEAKRQLQQRLRAFAV